MKNVELERGETLSVRLPGGAWLTVVAAPTGLRPLVQISAAMNDNLHALVEYRESTYGLQEMAFIRLYEHE